MASKTYEIAFQLGAKMASNFNSSFSNAGKSIQNLENQSKSASKGFLSLGDGANKVVSKLIGLGGVVGAGLGIKAMFDSAAAGQQKLAQMDAVLKSTGGAAGMTKDQLLDLADAQSKVTTFSKGSNVATENLLLTFTGISSKVFPDTLKAANDMATALGTDATSAAMTLGKALNDPATGLTKLTKQGVTFTEEQQSQIKAMVAAGDTAGAQTMMLQELQREFGGSAEAAGKTFPGQLTILKNNLSSVGASIATTVMPYITSFMNVITNNLPKIKETVVDLINTAAPYIAGVMSDISQIASNLLPNLGDATGNLQGSIMNLINNGFSTVKDIFDWLAQHGEVTKAAIIGIAGAFAILSTSAKVGAVFSDFQNGMNLVSGATGTVSKFGAAFTELRTAPSILSGIKGAFTAIFGFNPVILAVVAGIAAFAAIAYVVYENWDSISTFFVTLWGNVKSVFASFWDWISGFLSQWGPLILTFIAPIIGIPLLIAQHWDGIKEVLGEAWDSIVNSVSNAWESIKNAISNAWTAIINAIVNNPLFTVVSAIFKGILAVVIVVVYGLVSRVVTGWINIFNAVKGVLTNVWTFIVSIWNLIYTAVANVVTNVWNVIVRVWNTIYSVVSSILTNVWTVIVNVWNQIYTSVSSVLTTVWNFITTIWNNVYNSVSSIVSSIWNTIVNGFTSAYDGIVSIFGSIKDTVSGIFTDVWNVIKSVINQGIDMVNGFIGGVNSVIDVANKVPGVSIQPVGTIPQLANGGYIKHRAGGILANIGEGNEDEIVSPVSKLKSIVSNSVPAQSQQKEQQAPQIIYSPQVTIQGNASKEDVYNAISMGQADFNRMMDNYFKKKQRLSFS